MKHQPMANSVSVVVDGALQFSGCWLPVCDPSDVQHGHSCGQCVSPETHRQVRSQSGRPKQATIPQCFRANL